LTCQKFLEYVMYSSRMVHSSDSLVQTVMAKAVQVEKKPSTWTDKTQVG